MNNFHCTLVTAVTCVRVLGFCGCLCVNVWSPYIWKTLIPLLLPLTFQSGSYDLNPDAMRTFKGKNPSRYSYLVQGHENPYFLPGDEKKNWTWVQLGMKSMWKWGTWDHEEVTYLKLWVCMHISRAGPDYFNIFELVCINDKSQRTFLNWETATKEIHSYEQEH